MPSTPMSERNIQYFPMQSVQIDTDEFGNPIYDNAADAELIQKFRQHEIKDGVYPDISTYLQVISNGDMTVTVRAGYAHIQGVQVRIKEDVVLTVEDADPLVDRIDRVVLRADFISKEVSLVVKEDDVTLTREEGTTWELGLADLEVDHLNTVISAEEITDLRSDSDICGYASSKLGYLLVSDIIDDLSHTDTDKPLSAGQGKVLNDAKAEDSAVLHNTGNESMTGTKTFLNNPQIQRDVGRIYFKTANGTARAAILANATDASNIDFVLAHDNSVSVKNTAFSAYRPINASAFTVGSSIDFKENIVEMPDEDIKKLLDIALHYFTYKEEYNKDGGVRHMGAIAEEIIFLFPDAITIAIHEDEDGIEEAEIIGIDYSKLVVPCIGMIQQHEQRIEALEAQNSALTALLINKGLVTQEEINNL